jgi:hypothetical protein
MNSSRALFNTPDEFFVEIILEVEKLLAHKET